ncbi:MAG: 16S rRNA (uracil(1498)-N(3))-methyltransferase [Micropepsaceae bacterium]
MPQRPKDLADEGGLTRAYVEDALAEGARVVLNEMHSHHLTAVLRAAKGDALHLFNGREGEWRAVIGNIAKRAVTVEIEKQTAPQRNVLDLHLLAAPVKRTPFDYLVQKATELGIARIRPVITRRTIVERVNGDRMRANVIGAAEQSGRLDVPAIDEPVTLANAFTNWPAERRVMFCDEAGDAPPAAEALRQAGRRPWAILTGPEGGFDPTEREMIRTLSFVVPVSLGPRIMRADTAALAAITIWQATLGDWG